MDRTSLHMGLVMDPRGLPQGAVWLRWVDGSPYSALAVLPDCPTASPDGMDGCCEFDGHSGGHSWELADAVDQETAAEAQDGTG
ncbi:hypothetical protein [Streptomyces sp. NPDC008317]|uniref:hypothetical protein n=1 Tax=Streptomyces sp. NPDC008317 TaxID=3364827 RepID=UPI0036E6EA55